MYWFKHLKFLIAGKYAINSKYLSVQSHTSHSDTKLKDFLIKGVIYMLKFEFE